MGAAVRSVARLSLSHVMAPSVSDLWAVRSVAHLETLRSLVAVSRTMVEVWSEGRSADAAVTALRVTLEGLARVEGVTLSDRPAVPAVEARALLDLADEAKKLLPLALSALRAPRGERRLWKDRLGASLSEVERLLDRVPASP